MTIAVPEARGLDFSPAPVTAGPVDLTPEQVRVLLLPITPNRVQHHRGNAHLEAWDVRRWLNRIFGFGGWDLNTTELALVREIDLNGDGKRWTVIYRAQVRLTVRTADGRVLASYEDAAMGDSQNQPQLGQAHDQAMKTALSQALKRTAVNLGDQFGLSLYNDGSPNAVVIKSVPLAGAAPSAPAATAVPEDEPVKPEPSPEPAPEQQPQRSARAEAGPWETPPPAARPQSTDAAPRRDYLAEARAAGTPQQFARVRAAAVAAGHDDEYLDALDRIAAEKHAAAVQQRQPVEQPPRAVRPESVPLPGAPDDRRAIGLAMADMLAAGAAVGVSGPEVWQMFVDRHGHGSDRATVAELREITADLRAAGAQQ
jgi:hypothetical protein